MKKWLAVLMAVAFASASQGQNIIDSWDFDVPDTNNIAVAGSYSDLGAGGKTWNDNSISSIVNSNAVLEGGGTNNTQNFFRGITPSVRSGETSGKYQLSIDIVSADFANTAALDQSATFGIGVRKLGGGGSDDQLMRFQYQGGLSITNVNSSGVTNVLADADQIQITVDSGDISVGTVDFSIAGDSVSNLNFKQVYDLDAGTYEAYYTLDGGSETPLHTGALKAGWDLGQLRINSQQNNGGAIWEAGDLFKFDNIEFTQLVAPATTVYEGNLSIVDSKAGTHNTTPTNYTYKTFTDAEVGDVVVVSQASNKGYDPDSTDSTGVITFGGSAVLDEGPLNRVAIGGAPSTVWHATVTAAGSVDVNLNHTNSWQAIGTYLVRSDTDEIEIVATDANSATDPLAVTNLYEFGGTVDGQGLFFEAISGNDNGAGSPVSSNPGIIIDVDGNSRKIARGGFSGVSAITNIWTITAGKRTGVAGLVLAGLGESPRVTVEEWGMNSNGETQLSNNGLALPGSNTNAHQFAQTADDGLFVWAPTNSSAFSGKTTLTEPVVLSNAVATMTLTFTELDWSAVSASIANFGLRLYADDDRYVGVKITDQGGAGSDAIRVGAEADWDASSGSAGYTNYGSYGRFSTNGIVSPGMYDVIVELDYASSEIRLSGNWEWSPDGTSGVQTNSFDFAAAGITQLTRIQTRSANWSSGDYIVLDNLEVVYTALPEPDDPETPAEFYDAWMADYPGLTETGLGDDQDGDLLDNLTEYAFGGDPTDSGDQGNTPVQSQTSGGGTNYLEYVYYERMDAADRGLSSGVEVGTDLVFTNWTTAGIEFVGSGPSGIADFNAVTNRVSTDDGTQKFIRLEVEITP